MIYLIGVNHRYQFVNEKYEDSAIVLEEYLEEVLEEYTVTTIAEEFSEDAREVWNASKVIGEAVAEANGLEHVFCDPSRDERAQYGILGEDTVMRQMEGAGIVEYQAALTEDFRKRELFWYNMIEDCLDEDIIMICGVDHIDSFSGLLEEKGYDFEVLSVFRADDC